MHVSHLSLTDFRSYAEADFAISPGVTAFIGPNGQGKTNLVEAVEYVATQSSHRVASDQPLVRFGTEHAVVRADIVKDGRRAVIELQINPGSANRARLNRGAVPRARDVLGILRTVVFSPDDLDLVKGDPAGRRRFLDDLLAFQQPRYVGVRSDYDRVLRQRNMLLKTAVGRAGRDSSTTSVPTLDVWDTHLARTGAELLAARLGLLSQLEPHVAKAYAAVADSVPKPSAGNHAALTYRSSCELGDEPRDPETLARSLLEGLARRRAEEINRGVTLVGPHRDDLALTLGPLPARGYASHGESWSLALALRLAAFELLRADGDDPVLVLDDVFAELDERRRRRLADLVAGAEQVLVTAAVGADVPSDLADHDFTVAEGRVSRA